MKKVAAIFLVVVMVLGITGCGKTPVTYGAEDYILETEYKDDFRILQLTDIHMANKDDRKRQYDYLKTLIESAQADMILITGDLFTFADKKVARELFAFMDSFGIPWTLTFGNHDEQCYFPVDWMTGYLNEYGSNCLFRDLQDDDVFGNSNYAVNLMAGDQIHDQIILIDSNRYYYGDYWGYDYIKEDQIEWYEKIINYTTRCNGGVVVPSILAFHIPLVEFETAWNEADAGGEAELEYGTMDEECCCPDYNSGLFDKVLELDSTKVILVGHDHVNNSRINYKGVLLSYGVNSTDRIYYKEHQIGGTVVTIHNDHSLDFDYIYQEYDEVK